MLSEADSRLTEHKLRNSARELLRGIAADMRGTQSGAQQQAKSVGQHPDADSNFNEVARHHVDDRLSHAFEINALVAAYRALRGSVLVPRGSGASRAHSKRSPLTEKIQQHRIVDGLDEMLVEASRKSVELVLLLSPTCQCNKERIAALWKLADPLR